MIMLDLIFRNVCIVDGSGSPALTGDVGVEEGRIVYPADGYSAEQVIDGTGLTLCPGFIDSHSHADRWIGSLDHEAAFSRLNQGITTQVSGMCGSSVFPLQKTAKEFFSFASDYPKTVNYAFMVGHSSIREKVMGFENHAPNALQLTDMRHEVELGMEEGCFGLSSGLIYIPGVYADTQELIELTRTAAAYGGKYATHMRSEADHIVEAVKEAILIAKTAGADLFISHHKIMGRSNWGKASQTLALIHEAIDAGMHITIDQYPYSATQSGLNNSIPPSNFTEGYDHLTVELTKPDVRAEIKARMQSDAPGYNCGYRNAGGFANMLISGSPGDPRALGKTLEDFAVELGKDPFDTYFDLLVANHCKAYALFFSIDDEEINQIYLDDNTCVGSDCTMLTAQDHIHPRTYGSFVRSLCEFSQKRKLVSFEEAVRKQTSLTACRWGIENKGLIKDDYDADLVLLDQKQLADNPSYMEPRNLCGGILKVFNGGRLVYENGKLTGEKPGKIILHK